LKNLTSSWSSPANIALIKYWGKHSDQLPMNPSVSFTLSESKSIFEIKTSPKESQSEISLEFTFEGKPNSKFQQKIEQFLLKRRDSFPHLLAHHLTMNSQNTFPHSSGIASSASSMSALCLCLLSLELKLSNRSLDKNEFLKEASILSRLASGSASRSLFPFIVSWGEIEKKANTSDFYASPIEPQEIHSKFHHYCDSIVIVDSNEKSVSSRAGHELMKTHPFANERFLRAKKNCEMLLSALKNGNVNTFIDIVEEEALMLHALMMTSKPSYILLKPQSLLVIEKLREFRVKSQVPVCFTIDAGPNIHILYPSEYSLEVKNWMSLELNDFMILHDHVGLGPELLSK